MDMQAARIKGVLGKDCKRSPENALRYLTYLKKRVKATCMVTGVEEFDWERPYIQKGWDDPEYLGMKTQRPSFLDLFELLELEAPDGGGDDIVAQVRRVCDQQGFRIALSLLECTDFNDDHFQLIDDYAAWHRYY